MARYEKVVPHVEHQPSTEPKPIGQLVTIKEMADLLRVNTSWLYERTRLNQIPCIRVGKYVRFEPEKVIAYLKEQQAKKQSVRRPWTPI